MMLLPSIRFPIYSVMVLLALILNVITVFILSRNCNQSFREIIYMLLYENTGLILGAKGFTFLTNYRHLKDGVNFYTLGLSSYGALLGGLLLLLLFCFQFKKNVEETLYVFMPSVPLMYAIGKIGCFFAGCCLGIPYDGLGAVTYQVAEHLSTNNSFFPVQLVESVVFFLIFLYMIRQFKKKKFGRRTIGMGLILCGFSKFFLDFFRMSHIGKIMSMNQFISIIFILIGVIIYSKRLKALICF